MKNFGFGYRHAAPEGAALAFTPPADVKKRPPVSLCDGVKEAFMLLQRCWALSSP